MKVGDLVKWSLTEHLYHLAFDDMIDKCRTHRDRGIIIDKNPKRYFVYWESGEVLAQCKDSIEVISESR